MKMPQNEARACSVTAWDGSGGAKGLTHSVDWQQGSTPFARSPFSPSKLFRTPGGITMNAQWLYLAIILLVAVIFIVSTVTDRRRQRRHSQMDWSREAGGR